PNASATANTDAAGEWRRPVEDGAHRYGGKRWIYRQRRLHELDLRVLNEGPAGLGRGAFEKSNCAPSNSEGGRFDAGSADQSRFAGHDRERAHEEKRRAEVGSDRCYAAPQQDRTQRGRAVSDLF